MYWEWVPWLKIEDSNKKSNQIAMVAPFITWSVVLLPSTARDSDWLDSDNESPSRRTSWSLEDRGPLKTNWSCLTVSSSIPFLFVQWLRFLDGSVSFRSRLGSRCVLTMPTFETLRASQVIEEEGYNNFSMGRVRIGQVLDMRYQVVGKLGFGLGSTVYLARDLQWVVSFNQNWASSYIGREHHTVALKVFTNDLQNCEKTNIYEHLKSVKSDHPGRRHLRNALDTFTLKGPKGEHQCLVHEPMWESTRELLWRNESRRFTEALLKALLFHLFLALDYLHTEAHLIHTGESPLHRLNRVLIVFQISALIIFLWKSRINLSLPHTLKPNRRTHRPVK